MKLSGKDKNCIAALFVLLALVVFVPMASAEELVVLFTSNTNGYVKPCG